MQSQDKYTGAASDALRLQRIKIIGILTLTAIVMFALIFASISGKKTVKTNANEYFDKGSGETVSDPVNKSNESYGGTVAKPAVFLGFSKFLENGVTNLQLEKTKALINQYSTDQKANFNELSIASDSIGVKVPEVGTPETTTAVTAKMTVNRGKIYDLRISYNSITKVQVVLALEGKQLYDSGVVDLRPSAAIDDN